MSDQTKVTESLHSIFATKEQVDNLLDLVVSKRPVGVGRKSSYPYYKEYYAKWIKPYVDSMIETKQSIIFEFKTFCADGQMSEQTLYNKVNQSMRYLIDCMDTPELTYGLWRKVVDCKRDHIRKGVVIEFIKELRLGFEGQSPSPRMILPIEDGTPSWRHRMNDWLESPNKVRPFIQEGLVLTPELVKELKMELAAIKGVQAVVSAISVKIIPLN